MNLKVRHEAAEALGEFKAAAADAVPELIALLQDPEHEMRTAVAWALGKIEAAVAVPALYGLLKEREGNVSNGAYTALMRIRRGKDVLGKIGLLKNTDAVVRGWAAVALGDNKAVWRCATVGRPVC